jgi:hypothetical protein
MLTSQRGAISCIALREAGRSQKVKSDVGSEGENISARETRDAKAAYDWIGACSQERESAVHNA